MSHQTTNTNREENRSASYVKKDYEPHVPLVSPTVETTSKTRPEEDSEAPQLMNSRRLQIDYERDPTVVIWAAHSRYLLRRLTQPVPARIAQGKQSRQPLIGGTARSDGLNNAPSSSV